MCVPCVADSLGHLVINGDGTVTDISSGLAWQQETASSMTWEEALSYCENLLLGGYDDWRLPTIKELASIVDLEKCSPAIDTTAFPDTLSSNYWSSTTHAHSTRNPWSIYFHNGYYYPKSGSYYYVRAVRGGQSWSFGNLVILTPKQATGWEGGSEQVITWDTQGIEGNVGISLSRYGGKTGTFETIAENTENDGSYEWTVTLPVSFNCVIKIKPLNEPDRSAMQGLFSIFYINQPPNIPSNPWPTNGATGVSLDAGLSWTGGDPDTGDTVTYDVYFGTSLNPPEVATGQTGTTCDPGGLSPNTTYHWKVVARDNHGIQIEGPTWHFTTIKPGKIEFSNTAYNIFEDAGAAVITVNRSEGSDGEVSINFATSEGSAAPVSDYISTSGTLTFADGETSKTFSVTIVDNGLIEGNEIVNLTLSSPTGGAITGASITAVLTISDDADDVIAGDIDGSGAIDLKDLILTIQIISGTTPTAPIHRGDVNGDGRIGIEESVYVLQIISEQK